MASYISNTNLYGMNRKQLERIARNLGVSNVHSNQIAPSTLITSIKAK